jgi:hypothetical protein
VIVIARDWLRRAARTFIDSFLITAGVLLIPPLLGLVNDITETGGTGEIDFDINVWGKLLFAAVLSSLIAVFNGLKNRTEDATGKDFIVSKTG